MREALGGREGGLEGKFCKPAIVCVARVGWRRARFSMRHAILPDAVAASPETVRDEDRMNIGRGIAALSPLPSARAVRK